MRILIKIYVFFVNIFHTGNFYGVLNFMTAKILCTPVIFYVCYQVHLITRNPIIPLFAGYVWPAGWLEGRAEWRRIPIVRKVHPRLRKMLRYSKEIWYWYETEYYNRNSTDRWSHLYIKKKKLTYCLTLNTFGYFHHWFFSDGQII